MAERERIPEHVLAAAKFLTVDAARRRELDGWIGDESNGLKPGTTRKPIPTVLEITSILELPDTQ